MRRGRRTNGTGEDVLVYEAHALEPGEAGFHLAMATVLVASGVAAAAQLGKEGVDVHHGVLRGRIGQLEDSTSA